MSLVNDMLRDLDSRRQDTSGVGSGAEKLIPADQVPRTSRAARLLQLIMLVAFLSITGTAAALYIFERQQSTPPVVSVPDVPQTVAPVFAPAPTAPVQAELDASMLAEMQRMMARMESLEEQNQTLMQELARGNAAAPAQIAVPSHAQPTVPYTDATPAQVAATPAPVPVQQITPQQPVVAPAPAQYQAAAAAPVESTLVRNRSELSFRDEDRMQVQTALEQWQGNQRRAALATLTSFASNNPEAHQSRELLAKLLLQQGDTIAALELAEAGLRIAPANSGYRKIKARGMMIAGVPRDAAELLAQQVPAVAIDPEYHELLAAARLAAGQYDGALLSYRTLADNEPRQGRWWYGTAASFDALGRGPEAVDAYQRALQLEGLSVGLRQLSQQRISALKRN